ncbi:diguanylate cyclase (GGDEF)-like protein [Herbaspirillum sp. Sphag1AN]|uniref:putative bifunctional diguanylate cyclase/phosphodiesterase n=1 Tax=unclassified Herbaspirillum TaxID=2624150 RepID=UPI00161F8238|nr:MULTISPECIES: EAL domain-containing protein [unclassified Herbaspirillum]MBB3214168.1 diguanylate cyclase (GGDEF)-like protein [Herbaspirillum sp. Sphag1AN]MBB3247280.1 diguanylate cyclase (GGDEF)-like protein [Herbaspirillum sp. Sphag64]
MAGSISLSLICFSLFVATLSSYTVLEIAERIASQDDRAQRRLWLTAGALVFGAGIWATHFTGLMARNVTGTIGYDVLTTSTSFLLSVLVALVLLNRATQRRLQWPLMLVDGVLLGCGLTLIYYLGPRSVTAVVSLQPSLSLTALSIFLAVLTVNLCIWIIATLDVGKSDKLKKRLGLAAAMGGSIFALHWLSMASLRFDSPEVVTSTAIDGSRLLALVALATVIMLVIAVVFSGAQQARFLRTILGLTNHKLLHFATHDVLTGLPNRVLLTERVQHAIHVSKRSGQPFAVMFMDLDGFKTINDSLGHAVGDQLLIAVGQRIRACIRSEDMVARLGGDEFVVVMGNLPTSDVVETFAENILGVIRQEFRLDETSLRVTSSIGIAVFPNSGQCVDALLKNADAAMYEAKQQGRNTYRFFESAMHANAMRHLQIRQALQQAIERKQLFLHFQPKFDGQYRVLTGIEALLRWNHPELGSMSPVEFIPIAERSGQIVAIGNWVLREVCAQIQRWDAEGMPPVKVAINISSLQMVPELVDCVVAAIEQAGIASHRLTFEITETAVMKNVEISARVIADLQRLGCDVAIDDFGAGYSSLAYLQQFRCRQVKIDRLFTSRLEQEGDAGRAIVAAIIALAHALNMEVIAEGVETEGQLKLLQNLRCDQVQGFLLGRPANASDTQHLFTGQYGLFA